MNFVTPKKRQEWLGQAEDYADIVRRDLYMIIDVHCLHLVSSTNKIYFTTSRSIMSSRYIHRRWYSYVDAMATTKRIYHVFMGCGMVSWYTFCHCESLWSIDTLWNDLS